MVLHWNAVADYSHGFLIAPLAVYFAWERSRSCGAPRSNRVGGGSCRSRSGTLTLAVGRLGIELMNMRVSFVLTLIGLVLLLLGRQRVPDPRLPAAASCS